jgi:hypothetical protein
MKRSTEYFATPVAYVEISGPCCTAWKLTNHQRAGVFVAKNSSPPLPDCLRYQDIQLITRQSLTQPFQDPSPDLDSKPMNTPSVRHEKEAARELADLYNELPSPTPKSDVRRRPARHERMAATAEL